MNFYDYSSAGWFDLPRRTGERVVIGPYVDYAEPMSTCSPSRTRSGFLGVAAADIRVNVFESLLLPAIGHSGPPAVLMNAAGRVLASNTAHKVVGSLVADEELDRERSQVEVGTSTPDQCTGLPWTVSVLRKP